MKKTILAVALAALSISAFACEGNSCSISGNAGAAAGVRGSNTVVSGSAATASATGAGSSSLSYAANVTTAVTSVNAASTAGYTSANCDSLTTGSVAVGGSVALTSDSVAYNVSNGHGATGAAAAGGLATGSVEGAGVFSGGNNVGHIAGVAAGSADANLASGVVAGRNGGAEEVAVAGASFEVTSAASLATDGTCTGRSCVTTGDTKSATTSALATAYSDKATFAVGGVSLHNAAAGSIVNASASDLALAGGSAVVGKTVDAFSSKK